MMLHVFFLPCLAVLMTACSANSVQYPSVELDPSADLVRSDSLPPDTKFVTFCYPGQTPSPLAHWRHVRFDLDIEHSHLLAVYTGSNHSHVVKQYEEASARYLNFVPPCRDRQLRLAPFERTCVGVSTSSGTEQRAHFTVRLVVRHIDFWFLLASIAGVVLFLNAQRLSDNVVFHYSGGMLVGVLGAVLIAVYLLSRMVPKRSGAWALLFTGWSLGIYILQYMADNARLYLHMYRNYILLYLFLSAAVSLAVCYRYGPVRDVRTRTLIRWLLQLLGLTAVYWSGNMVELSAAVIVVLVLYTALPGGLVSRIYRSLRVRFVKPRPRRLLTEEEYAQQGVASTRQALEELRRFCRSPQCDAWRTVSRLDSPMKFVSFMEGDSHLSDDEMTAYELEYSRCDEVDGGDCCDDEFMTSDEDDF